jgi:hypothetical protein
MKYAERAFIVLFLLTMVLLPPFFVEAFPFTTAAMFADPFPEMRLYKLTDARGQILDPYQYGLRTGFFWHLEQTLAVQFPESMVAPAYRDPDFPQLIEHIQKDAINSGAQFPLHLECKLYGALDERRAGLKSVRRWDIPDPRK